MKSLFSHNYQLVGTDFAGRWGGQKADRHYVTLVRRALVGDGVGDSVLPGIDDLELRGRGEVTHPSALVESHVFHQRFGGTSLPLPAISLSHGYQSTIAWVADFIGQAMVDAGDRATEVTLDTLEALVLIDELDLHLHPKWQLTLVRSLKRAFPRVQFVATTHSPLVLAGLDDDEVWILDADERGSVTARPAGESARLMTSGGILQTFFGVERVDPDDTAGKLREFGFLASTPERTDDDERRLVELLEELKRLGVEPQWTPVERAEAASTPQEEPVEVEGKA